MSGSPPRHLGLEELEDRDVPATVAVADTYNVQVGQVLTVPVTSGLLANDFNTLQPGAVLTAQLIAGPTYQNSLTPLPANSLTVNPNGTITFIAPSNVAPDVGPVLFVYQATNPSNGEVGTALVTINLQQQPVRLIATGADIGGGPHVRVYEAGTSNLRFNFFPYEATFTGGVRVAVGDVNSDGVDDIVTIPESGGSARLQVYSGADGGLLVDQIVFGTNFRGGGYVAVGDINGDGRQDIIVGAGEGGGPRVAVFSYDITAPGGLRNLADFFAYGSDVRTGVRVAAGDLDGIGRDFLVTAPGAGGGPQVNVFDGSKVVGKTIVPSALFSFFAGDSGNRDGVYIATGNTRGDGRFDIIAGNGAGPGVVSVYDGRTAGLVRQIIVPADPTPTGGSTGGFTGTNTGGSNVSLVGTSGGTLLNTQPPGSLTSGVAGSGLVGVVSGGVRVAATDYNDDGLADIITATGPGNASRVRIFNTKTQVEITSIVPFDANFLGGVNVAASRR